MEQLPAFSGFRRAIRSRAKAWHVGERIKFAVYFYVLAPSFLALLSGLSSSGTQALKDPHYYVVYWLCTAIPAWIAAGLGTSFVSFILRPFRDLNKFHTSFLLVLCLGYLAGINIIWMPLSEFRNDLLSGLAMPGQHLRHAWEQTSPYLALYQVLHGLACWVGLNYLAAALFGVPRFGFHVDFFFFTRIFDRAKIALEGKDRTLQDIRSGLSEAELKSKQELTERIAPHTLDRIVAMRAEDHYTKVYFRDGETLIYMRFSRAIEGAAALGGLRTHRSYWVRLENIRKPVDKGGKKFLELNTGLLFPVSRERKSAIEKLLLK